MSHSGSEHAFEASLRHLWMVRVSGILKPSTSGIRIGVYTTGSTGVEHDSAQRKIPQEPERPDGAGRTQHSEGMHNFRDGSSRESDRPIVAMNWGNSQGAKEPDREHALNNNNGD